MSDWQAYPVDLGSEYGLTQVEARETASGGLEWRGLPGTTLATWAGSGPRTNDPVVVQVQVEAYEWFHTTKAR